MCFIFRKKVRLFSQNDVLFLFYFLINPAGTTETLSRKGETRTVLMLNLQVHRIMAFSIQKICTSNEIGSRISLNNGLCFLIE